MQSSSKQTTTSPWTNARERVGPWPVKPATTPTTAVAIAALSCPPCSVVSTVVLFLASLTGWLGRGTKEEERAPRSRRHELSARANSGHPQFRLRRRPEGARVTDGGPDHRP